jgi:hypothetical protein
MAVQQNLLLDSEIRDWVLLPLVFILLMVGLGRNYVMIATKTRAKAGLMQAAAEQQLASYCRLVMANAGFVPYDSLTQRVERLNQKLQAPAENNQMAAAMDPSMMGDMMKGQMMGVLPNIAMMSIVTSVFAGFVIAKFPFPCSNKFKGMVQRGVDIDDLDGSYATSMSMYFLIQYGLQGILQLILGQNEGDEMAMMQQQMSNPMGGAGAGRGQPPQDMNKVFKGLAEELQFTADTHAYQLENATALLLQGK